MYIKICEKAIDCIDHKTSARDGLQKILYAKIPSIHRNPFGLKPRPIHFHRKVGRKDILRGRITREEISRILNRSFAIWHLSTLQPSHPTLFPRFSRKSCTLICIFANHLPISIRFIYCAASFNDQLNQKTVKEFHFVSGWIVWIFVIIHGMESSASLQMLRDNEESRNCTIMTNASIDGF